MRIASYSPSSMKEKGGPAVPHALGTRKNMAFFSVGSKTTSRSTIAAFALVWGWAMEYPSLMLSSSTLVWNDALGYGLEFVLAVILVRLIATRLTNSRTNVILFAAAGLLATLCALVGATTSSLDALVIITALLVLFGAFQLILSLNLMAKWSVSASTAAALRATSLSLLFAGGLVAVAFLLSYLVGWAANLTYQLVFAKTLLAFVPLVAGMTALVPGLKRKSEPESAEAPSSRTEGAEPVLEQSADSVAMPVVAVFSVVSLLTMVVNGLSYQPYAFVGPIGVLTHWLHAPLVIVIAAVLLWKAPYHNSEGQAERATSEYVRTLFFVVIAFVAIAMGASLLQLPTIFWLASVLQDTAKCLCWAFVACVVVTCDSLTLRNGARIELTAAKKTGLLLASGIVWAVATGIGLTHEIGLDAPFIGMVSVVLIVAVVLALVFMSMHRSRIAVTQPRASSADACHTEATEEAPEQSSVQEAQQAFDVMQTTRKEALEPYHLTTRELEVALRVLNGSSGTAIASALDIKEATVRFHIGNIYKKVGVQSKGELIELVERITVKAVAPGAEDGVTEEELVRMDTLKAGAA